MGSGAKGRFSAGRERFRRWRHRRPFWGGLLTLLSGLVIFGSTQLTLGSMQVRVGVEGMQSIVIPIVLVVAGLLIWFMPDHRVFYGIITLVVAVYSLIGVNLGGFIIGLLLGVAGGALAIAWAPRPGDVAGAETSDTEAPDDSPVDDAADDDTVSVDDMLSEDPDDTVDDGVPQPDAVEEPGSPDESQPKHRARFRTVQRSERPSIRSAVAAGAGCAGLALVAFAAPGLVGQAGAVVPNLPIPTLPPLLPTSEPEPTGTPEPPDKPKPTVSIEPTSDPEPTESPEPTSEPEPTESPEPTSDPEPTESPEPTEPEGTSDPESPEPTPTESPVIEVPEGETPSEPRDLETPEQVVAEEPGRLTGSSITMEGLSYDGVVDVQTDSGTKRLMQFSMDASVTDDFSLLVPDEKGDLLTLASQLTVEGDVKFYSDRFSGTLLGVPLTFTPDFPPPLTLPVMTFGQPDINLALVTSDSLTADEMRQFFPDDE